MLHFICRIKSGTERKTLLEAAQRVHSAWLPFSMESTRRKRRREPIVTVRPVMPYLFCKATHQEMMRLFQHRNTFANAFFVPAWHENQVQEYQRKVEREFADSLAAYRADTMAFHCNFKPGQIVRLRDEGLDLFPAKFKGITDDGHYKLETEMFGQTVPVTAEPHRVTA